MLENGFIRTSVSRGCRSVFVKKKDGSMRLFITSFVSREQDIFRLLFIALWPLRVLARHPRLFPVWEEEHGESTDCVGDFLGQKKFWHHYGSSKVEAITKWPGRDLLTMTEKGEKFRSFVWPDERQVSFEELKRRLVSAYRILIFIGSGGFQIYCDASKERLGCVLCQWEGDRLRFKAAEAL
ncbi:putative reverse transcriptase domain-containing protein [Tanacetum coccineum]